MLLLLPLLHAAVLVDVSQGAGHTSHRAGPVVRRLSEGASKQSVGRGNTRPHSSAPEASGGLRVRRKIHPWGPWRPSTRTAPCRRRRRSTRYPGSVAQHLRRAAPPSRWRASSVPESTHDPPQLQTPASRRLFAPERPSPLGWPPVMHACKHHAHAERALVGGSRAWTMSEGAPPAHPRIPVRRFQAPPVPPQEAHSAE